MSNEAESHLMNVGDQIQRKKAKLNHLQTLNGWSCSFQSWHTCWFGYTCRFNSCKLWKEEEQSAPPCLRQTPTWN